MKLGICIKRMKLGISIKRVQCSLLCVFAIAKLMESSFSKSTYSVRAIAEWRATLDHLIYVQMYMYPNLLGNEA